MAKVVPALGRFAALPGDRLKGVAAITVLLAHIKRDGLQVSHVAGVLLNAQK
jgi:hypothetical protein